MSRQKAEVKPMVRSELREGGTLLHIVLDRPKGNVLTIAMMEAISDVLQVNQINRRLKLAVLQGAGGHFSYGASVEEHLPEQAPRMLSTFHTLLRHMAGYPVPVASLVEGNCLGGAFEMALCSHFIFAAPTAVFGCPEIKLGVFPPVLAAIGSLRLGGAAAERLILTGSTLDVGAAEKLGFLTEILPGEDPLSEVESWYRNQLLPLSASALRQATRAARMGSGMLEALGEPLSKIERFYIDEVLSSRDGREGITAFLERRKPKWEDA